jgi:hypothetical protein
MAYEIANRLVSGRKTVAAHGTAEKLIATATDCFMVIVSADLGNTNPVVVGSADVVAASGSQKGIVLVPGNNPVLLLINDLSKVYVDAQTNGDAVCYTYFAAP